jgi:hypothetical protein
MVAPGVRSKWGSLQDDPKVISVNAVTGRLGISNIDNGRRIPVDTCTKYATATSIVSCSRLLKAPFLCVQLC